MLTLFPLLLCDASYIIYGKRRLVKNDGGLVNVYNLICEAGVQPVLNANGEPKETSKSETTQTLNLRVYFLFCFLDFCAAVDAEWQLSSASFYVFNICDNPPCGVSPIIFPLLFHMDTCIPNLINYSLLPQSNHGTPASYAESSGRGVKLQAPVLVLTLVICMTLSKLNSVHLIFLSAK